MKISICIVNYNSKALLEKCLESIRRYPPDCEYEIIVVDNNSADGLPNAAIDCDRVKLIRNNHNAGFAVGNNQAFEIADGEYFLLLNPDTEVCEGSISALLDCANEYSKAGLISARLLSPDGSTQIGFNMRRLPGFLSVFAQIFMLDEVCPANPIKKRAEYLSINYNETQKVEQPAASALLYRRNAWEKIGAFDARFVNWFNDVDLCKRVLDGGFEIIYCSTARVMHHGGMGSASRSLSGAIVEYYRSLRLYFLKHHGMAGYFTVSTFVLIGMVMRWLVLVVMPGLARFVKIRIMQNESNAMRQAFKLVLLDTIKSWVSLPRRFNAYVSE